MYQEQLQPRGRGPRASKGRRRTRRFVAFVVLDVVLLVAGVAFAEWLASGAGSGYAKARTAIALTTSPATPTESLYPGSVGSVALTVNNANPYPVTARTIVADGPVVASSSACQSAGHGVSFVDQTGSWLIPAGGSTTLTVEGAVSMAATSPDACQGATFTIPVRIAGQSGSAATTSTSATPTTQPTTTTTPPPAVVGASPTSWNYGQVTVNQSVVKRFTLTNTGGSAATQPSLAASPLGVFFIDGTTCGGSIPSGGSCTVDVRFTPPSVQGFFGQLQATGSGYSVGVPLQGAGVTAQMSMPSNVGFPPTSVGQSSTVNFPVQNMSGTSTGPLSFTFSGVNASDFSIAATTNCGPPLNPGQTCNLGVTFSPTVTGSRAANVTVSANPGGMATSSLNGTGT